jgi:hypothetical protein
VKRAVMLGLLLMLWSSAAYAGSGYSTVTLDVIGSNAENAQVDNPGGRPVEVTILGSTTSNIVIGNPQAETDTSCCCNSCYPNEWADFSRSLCYPYSTYIPTRYHKSFLRTPCGCTSPCWSICTPQIDNQFLTIGGYR